MNDQVNRNMEHGPVKPDPEGQHADTTLFAAHYLPAAPLHWVHG